jgi:2-polyprenyl-6-methoxyphenol hydroxylase-like FAD-dependent oxidoreductase
VAVVGCGTAGAAAALFLSRAGHRVTVFERVPQPGPVGAGIMMQPSGLVVLERLGLARRVLERGAVVPRLVCETTGGRTILDLAYESLAPGLYGVGLHRGVLFETLYGALLASDARLRLGVSIARMRRGGAGGAGGLPALVDDDGASHGPFELVLVCDGARSRLRDSMHDVSQTVRRYPWGAMWFIARDPSGRHAGRLHQIVRGARRMVGLLPTGLGPGDGDVPLVSLFVSTRADDVDAQRERGLAAWKEAVREIAPATREVLDQIDHFDRLTFASYYDVVLPRWHGDRVAILGDAGHATSPQLGQGCNLALCDAAALAHAVDTETAIDVALHRFTEARRDHLGFYQLATRWLTPFFQSDSDALGWVRDTLMGPACRIPYVRREMVRSMAGTKTGFVAGSMDTRMPAEPLVVESPLSA